MRHLAQGYLKVDWRHWGSNPEPFSWDLTILPNYDIKLAYICFLFIVYLSYIRSNKICNILEIEGLEKHPLYVNSANDTFLACRSSLVQKGGVCQWWLSWVKQVRPGMLHVSLLRSRFSSLRSFFLRFWSFSIHCFFCLEGILSIKERKRPKGD